MIRQTINVDNKWRVIVYYNIDYDFFDIVKKEMLAYSTPVEKIDDTLRLLHTHRVKAFTSSNLKRKVSVVGFGKHKDKYDLINSIAHEAEHIKQDMLRAYKVKDEGEPPAYTIGYLVVKMLRVMDMI